MTAGSSSPGKAHPPSRTARARRCARFAWGHLPLAGDRCGVRISTTRPALSRITVCRTASHARRCSSPGVMGPIPALGAPPACGGVAAPGGTIVDCLACAGM